jgi:hypothetical protein
MVKKIILGLISVMVAAFVGISLYLNAIVVNAVETFGSKYLGVNVTLDDADISLLSGHIALNGLVVGSPKGFQASHTFHFDEVRVALDMGSLASNVVKVYTITITRPHVVYEVGPNGTNIKAIQAHVAQQEHSAEKPVSQNKSVDSKVDGKPVKRVEIDKVTISDGVVESSIAVINASVKLPDITLTNIGKDGQEMSFVEVTTLVVKTVVKQITRLNLKNLLDMTAGQLENVVGGVINNGVGDAVKGVSNSLKGMFGGDKTSK